MKINYLNEVAARISLTTELRKIQKVFTELKDYQVDLILCDNKKIQKINKIYRKKDKATDVLSYSLKETQFNPEKIAGEVIISYPYARKQAEELGVSIKSRLVELIIHGLVHILGFDHEISKVERLKMEKKEEYYLNKLS